MPEVYGSSEIHSTKWLFRSTQLHLFDKLVLQRTKYKNKLHYIDDATENSKLLVCVGIFTNKKELQFML